MSVQIHSEISICACCLFALAADGCGCEVNGYTHETEPLSAIPAELDVVPGGEHNDDCPNKNLVSAQGDCYCDDLGFSYKSCEGCGGLGGDRYRATLFYRD
jgi:hypothetical protein